MYQQLGTAQADATPVYSSIDNQLGRGATLANNAADRNINVQKINKIDIPNSQSEIANRAALLKLAQQAREDAQDAASESFWSDIISSVGGVLAAPFTGGTSLLGAGLSALSGLGKVGSTASSSYSGLPSGGSGSSFNQGWGNLS